MFLRGFEALAVALLFLAPGALFLYESARYYSPEMRSQYLRRQFPLELAIHYLIASAVIHGILLFVLAWILFTVALATHNPALIQDWHGVLLRFPQVSTSDYVFFSMAGLGYLACSLLLAYFGAKRLRQYLVLPEPLWCEEMIKILDQGGTAEVCVVDKSNEVTKGTLIGFRYVGDEIRSFEMLLSVISEADKARTTVWLGSEVIGTLSVEKSASSWKFLFASTPKSNQDQTEPPCGER